MRHLRHLVLIALAAAAGLATAGCGSTHPQLDRVLRTLVGSGARTTAAAHMPHATYTFFNWEDPPQCVQGTELLDSSGKIAAGSANLVPRNTALLVQRELPGGDYRLRTFTTAPRCAWMVEEILNRMQSDETPPSPEPAPHAPDFSASVASTATPIDVPVAGLYRVSVSVEAPEGKACPYSVSLLTAAGDSEFVDAQPGNFTRGSSTVFLFLTPGPRTVTGTPDCQWDVSVAPLIGPNGGGVRGFAPSTA